MVTINTRPTTLAEYKTALDRAELTQRTLTQELESTRKANTQISADLQAAKLEASRSQEQFTAQLKDCQVEQAKLRKEMAALEKQLTEAQAETAKAQADKAATEAQASRQLTEASEVMTRQKLAAVAAADREVKLTADIAALRKQLDQATTVSLTVPDTSEQTSQLRKLIDALVAENRRLAENCDQLSQDQFVLTTTVEAQKLAQIQAVDKARTEAQLAARQEIDQLKETSRLGQARLSALTAQLQSTGKLEVLAPDQVGALMSGFLQQMEGGMPSLRLAEGELKLKLGLASSGQTQGFVILQPGAQVDAKTSVHEVALKFDRSGTLNLPQTKP